MISAAMQVIGIELGMAPQHIGGRLDPKITWIGHRMSLGLALGNGLEPVLYDQREQLQ